jgi:hypothetical protein
MMGFIFITLVAVADRPVIRLDESVIEGQVRKPTTIEIQGQNAQKAVEDMALKQLIRLEKRLLEKNNTPPSR